MHSYSFVAIQLSYTTSSHLQVTSAETNQPFPNLNNNIITVGGPVDLVLKVSCVSDVSSGASVSWIFAGKKQCSG